VPQLRLEISIWTYASALLPLLVRLLLVWFGMAPTTDMADMSRELIFCALSIFALTAAELHGVSADVRTHTGFASLTHTTAWGTILSAVLYGAFLNAAESIDRQRIFHCSLIVAALSFWSAAITEYLLRRWSTDGTRG
jgi:hypothetical protein